jgi:hypothetical protein
MEAELLACGEQLKLLVEGRPAVPSVAQVLEQQERQPLAVSAGLEI